MLEIVTNDTGELCPVIMCDFCRQPVTMQTGGAAIWLLDGPGNIKFAHKGLCHHSVEALFPEKPMWETFETFFENLAHNEAILDETDLFERP